jgi:predicted ATPase
MRRCVITGAPGTGKTTLVRSLAQIGPIVGEPARELIAEHRDTTGERSLDGSPGFFIERLVARSIEKFDGAPDAEFVIYDRGLPDCVAYARVFGVDPGPALIAAAARRYSNPVFIAPPWEEIYSVDDMRRASFDQISAFHDELVTAYASLGYELVELAKASVIERVHIVMTLL